MIKKCLDCGIEIAVIGPGSWKKTDVEHKVRLEV